MSLFKCKMCGGSLEIAEGVSVATCEYCGTQQTLPKLHDEKLAHMIERADQFRRTKNFDKATEIYEEILAEQSDDAEIYWLLVLCRYGIEYVDDPLTGRKIPTINRAQYTSIFDDPDYQSAIRCADTTQKGIYEKEAECINGIQRDILAISSREEPYDVFICYKETDENGERTHDSVYATELYYELKELGYKVFFARITLEDKLGSAYEPYIFAALNSAKVMVVLGTKPEYFNAVWVKNEWSRFLALMKNDRKKTLIPAYKDMDPYNLPKEFSHLQALNMSRLGFMSDLTRGIEKLVGEKKQQSTFAQPQPQVQEQAQPQPQPRAEEQVQPRYDTQKDAPASIEAQFKKGIGDLTKSIKTGIASFAPKTSEEKSAEVPQPSIKDESKKADIKKLKTDRTVFIFLGIIFLCIFPLASIFFFFMAYRRHKKLKQAINGQNIEKKNDPKQSRRRSFIGFTLIAALTTIFLVIPHYFFLYSTYGTSAMYYYSFVEWMEGKSVIVLLLVWVNPIMSFIGLKRERSYRRIKIINSLILFFCVLIMSANAASDGVGSMLLLTLMLLFAQVVGSIVEAIVNLVRSKVQITRKD